MIRQSSAKLPEGERLSAAISSGGNQGRPVCIAAFNACIDSSLKPKPTHSYLSSANDSKYGGGPPEDLNLYALNVCLQNICDIPRVLVCWKDGNYPGSNWHWEGWREARAHYEGLARSREKNKSHEEPWGYRNYELIPSAENYIMGSEGIWKELLTQQLLRFDEDKQDRDGAHYPRHIFHRPLAKVKEDAASRLESIKVCRESWSSRDLMRFDTLRERLLYHNDHVAPMQRLQFGALRKNNVRYLELKAKYASVLYEEVDKEAVSKSPPRNLGTTFVGPPAPKESAMRSGEEQEDQQQHDPWPLPSAFGDSDYLGYYTWLNNRVGGTDSVISKFVYSRLGCTQAFIDGAFNKRRWKEAYCPELTQVKWEAIKVGPPPKALKVGTMGDEVGLPQPTQERQPEKLDPPKPEGQPTEALGPQYTRRYSTGVMLERKDMEVREFIQNEGGLKDGFIMKGSLLVPLSVGYDKDVPW